MTDITNAPERIRVAQDADGFWTCREAISGSQEYVRADIYDAVLSTLPIAGEGKVKALEWKDEGGEYIAQSVIGWFHIGRPASYWNLTTPHGTVISHETLDEAKAAAQSDYEARILSALISSPGKDGGQEVEAVGYVSAYNLNEVKEGRVGCIYPSGTLRPEKEIPLYTRHQPTRMTNSADEIWIEPNPPADPNRGQDWSETNAWGQQATKYVRADVAETLMKALEPFAKVGEYILAEAPPEATLFTVFTDCGGNTAQVSLEYFREAIAALSASQSTSREK